MHRSLPPSITDLLPPVPIRWLGNGRILGAVNNDVFWHDTLLEHALLGVFSSASEQTWRFNLEVANALSVSVNVAPAILLDQLFIGLLKSFLLFLCTVLPVLILLYKEGMHLSEVTLGEVCDYLPLFMCHDLGKKC